MPVTHYLATLMEPSGHVTHIDQGDREISIVGTAHVSQRSVEEVRYVIGQIRPDTVCVELDRTRYEALVDANRWRNLDLFQIIREKKVLYLLASLALSAYQKKIGARLGVKPGAEMLAAIEAAKEVGAELVLADRDIQVTLKRTWASLRFWDKARLASGLLATPFSMGDIDEAQIEELKDRDTISEMLEELAAAMPGLKRPLIDERDQYLMSSVLEAKGKKIVVVVGAGHVAGMVKHGNSPTDRQLLSRLPPPSHTGKIVGWVITLVVLGAFYFGWTQHSSESFYEMLRAWILPTSIGCGLATLLSRAHPLTLLSGILAAPLTTLNPTIGVGMVTALVEAWVRRPTVADCEQIPESMLSLRGWYQNRATRVLLVFVLSSLGASLGMAVGVTWVLSLLR